MAVVWHTHILQVEWCIDLSLKYLSIAQFTSNAIRSVMKTLSLLHNEDLLFQVYKVGVVLNKIGRYPIGTYPSQSTCNGVVFTFSQGQSGDSVRDGLVRSIIFSIPPPNHNSINNPGISGIPGDHNKMTNIIWILPLHDSCTLYLFCVIGFSCKIVQPLNCKINGE